MNNYNYYYNEMPPPPPYYMGDNCYGSDGSHNGYAMSPNASINYSNVLGPTGIAFSKDIPMSSNYMLSPRYLDDMSAYDFNCHCQRFLNSLQLFPSEIEMLQMRTRGQSENDLWRQERRKRLTSSNFGRVLSLRDETFRGRLVQEILNRNGNFSNEATWCRILSEQKAIDAYKNCSKQNVEPCGLFVHPQFGYLGASPDGLVGKDGLVEVKCPLSPNRTYLHYVNCGGAWQWQLRTNHDYFYRIQGQLEVTGREWCDFVVWIPKGIEHVERVYRDKSVWNVMFPELKRFYELSLLPELVDPRIPRGRHIREPDFVLRANAI